MSEDSDASVNIGPPRPVKKSDSIGPPKPTKKRKRSPSPSSKEDEEEKIEGKPSPKKTKRDFTPLLEQLPSQPLYEFSLNHISEICYLEVTPITEFVLTVSTEGYLKFWKRSFESLEFVKAFRVSPRPVLGVAASSDGTMACLLCSLSDGNGCIKTFDVNNVALSNVVRLPFPLMYGCVEFIPDPETKDWRVVVCEKNTSKLYIINPLTLPKDPKGAIVKSFDHIHQGRKITLLKWNKRFEVMISVDNRGVIEYWSTNKKDAFNFPNNKSRKVLHFEFKSQTDLYALAKSQTSASSITMSLDCTKFAVTSRDRMIRIFHFQSGKLIRTIDETIREIQRIQATSDDPKFTLHGLDFGKRMEVEKQVELMWSTDENVMRQLQRQVPLQAANVVFDTTGRIILYGSPIGVKMVDIASGDVIQVLGKHEQNLRFLGLSLFLGRPTISRHRLASISAYRKRFSVITLTSDAIEFELKEDPLLLCTAYGKNRFFVFSKRMFEEDTTVTDGMTRDKTDESELDIASSMNFLQSSTSSSNQISGSSNDYDEDEDDDEEENEENLRSTIPSADGTLPPRKKKKRKKKKKEDGEKKKIASHATIHTEYGDIRFRLFAKECPIAVHNFVELSKSNYYNGCIFHRVIRNFMIQTGDPTGNGTGGTSIYGRHFQNEIRLPKLSHSEPFMVSMANKGKPGTNGSQFFITLAKTPWLDGKHTVFGAVNEGKNVVKRIGSVRTSKYEKPYQDIKIISVSIFYEDEVEEDEDESEEEEG